MKHLLPLFLLIALSGCEGFFGKKTDLDFIDAPDFTNRDVAYVPIQPIIEGFASPSDVIAGYDGLIYVVDEGTEEIIAFDQAGREQGRTTVPGVTDIAMDRQLNILAIGTFDTNINEVSYTLAALYRLDLNTPAGFGIDKSSIVHKRVHPYYFKSSFSSVDAEVRFTGIDVMADNSYYVTRIGPRVNENQVGGPDDGVLLFNHKDEYVSNVFVSTGAGFFRGYFKDPVSICTYAKPPQAPGLDETADFFVAMADPAVPIKVQALEFNETDFGSSYNVRLLDFSDTSEANDFLYRPGRFITPTDITLTGDGTNYLFVLDASTDSLYQFTTTGREGVNPPPGSSETKNIIASFGGRGQEATQFNNPSGVAYLDRIVYVTDRGNGRLLRFKLTTDFD
ncbi:MAG: hypothetical protein Salg2KO_04800 [Salibacteraceae bacterium]